jgi:predicted DCC family thiol-disulfide oxidoreductase YuxK
MTMRSISIEQSGGKFTYEGSAEKVFAPEHSVRTTEAKELLKSHGIQYIDLQTVYFVSDKVSVRSAAAFNILHNTKAPWRWLSIFRFLPIALTDTIYKWVAKNRYRWN